MCSSSHFTTFLALKSSNHSQSVLLSFDLNPQLEYFYFILGSVLCFRLFILVYSILHVPFSQGKERLNVEFFLFNLLVPISGTFISLLYFYDKQVMRFCISVSSWLGLGSVCRILINSPFPITLCTAKLNGT